MSIYEIINMLDEELKRHKEMIDDLKYLSTKEFIIKWGDIYD